MEIKEKWKTDVRELMLGMGTQAALNIIREKKDPCLKQNKRKSKPRK